MSNFLWILFGFLAYVAGIVTIFRVTPMLLSRSYDEGLFMGLAALDVIGAILAFAGIIVPLLLFSNAIAMKIFAFILLLGMLFIAGRLAWFSLRPHLLKGTFKISRIAVGCYCLFLAGGALYYMFQIVTA